MRLLGGSKLDFGGESHADALCCLMSAKQPFGNMRVSTPVFIFNFLVSAPNNRIFIILRLGNLDVEKVRRP